MTAQDIAIGALCAWRENRQAGQAGLQSIINVLQNRAKRDNSSIYAEATRRLQFSSLTAPGDPELTLWPPGNDPQWLEALSLMEQASEDTLDDLTAGSTLYYAPYSLQDAGAIDLPNGNSIPFPRGWNPAAVAYQAKIGNQVFFREVSTA